MSKRKTKEQKMISDLHRKLQTQAQQIAPTRHIASPSVYSYKAHNTASVKSPTTSLIPTTHVKHDLIKTGMITAGILLAQMILLYLLKSHIIMIPMVRY